MDPAHEESTVRAAGLKSKTRPTYVGRVLWTRYVGRVLWTWYVGRVLWTRRPRTRSCDAVWSMSRPPRLTGFTYKGLYRYFLTICTFRRQKFFVNETTVGNTLLQFRKTAAIESFECSAYCFMPDHVHFLLEALSDAADFRKFCKLAKQRSGSVHARERGGRLWQEGYHDRVLRESDDSMSVARYLLNNPVRAGLVVSPVEYPYLGSDRWTVEELIESSVIHD